MEYLKAYYPNFKMEMENIFAQQIWYESLNHINDASFEILIKKYSRGNEYPPQSPTHLLNWFDDMINDKALEILNEYKQLEKDSYVFGRYVPDPLADPNTLYVNYDLILEKTENPIIKELVASVRSRQIKQINKDSIIEHITTTNRQLAIGTNK